MKANSITFIFTTLIICYCLMSMLVSSSSDHLKIGTFSFIYMNAQKDEFTIEIRHTIPPNSHILFTDTEWNGTYFGIDEHTMSWNTGKDSIYPNTRVSFKRSDSQMKASIGTTQGILKIATKEEAIFAYQGTARMPVRFIAGIAYQLSDYGTLINTGLTIDSTAILVK